MTPEQQAVIDAATALAEHHKSTNGYTHESWRSQQIFLLQNVLDAVDRLTATAGEPGHCPTCGSPMHNNCAAVDRLAAPGTKEATP